MESEVFEVRFQRNGGLFHVNVVNEEVSKREFISGPVFFPPVYDSIR